jgi:hypothetical protein
LDNISNLEHCESHKTLSASLFKGSSKIASNIYNKRQQKTTKDNKRQQIQQKTTKDNKRQQKTTKDNKDNKKQH